MATITALPECYNLTIPHATGDESLCDYCGRHCPECGTSQVAFVVTESGEHFDKMHCLWCGFVFSASSGDEW